MPAATHPPFSPLWEYCCRFCRVWEGPVLPTQTKTVFQAWEGVGGFLMVTQYPSWLLLPKGLRGTARVSQRCARNSVPAQVKKPYNPECPQEPMICTWDLSDLSASSVCGWGKLSMYLRLNFLPPPRVGVGWRCKQDYIYLKEINTNAGVYEQIHSCYACQKTERN